ncbi:structural polyprotein [Bat badicivirus 2]|uniref:structural polyprotein n=1 Tax=Bat badicivirus 2 TaxID=1958786 RepID=UPI000983A652|nr:structural polyprotein [Bat badicivirus 2]AQP31146.1 structural polyprotein [Bat badicivirus 2]
MNPEIKQDNNREINPTLTTNSPQSLTNSSDSNQMTDTNALAPAKTNMDKVSTSVLTDARQPLEVQTFKRFNDTARFSHHKLSSMPEQPHTTQSTIEVPYLIKTVQWTTSQSVGTELYTFLVPDFLEALRAPLNALLSSFTYWNASFRFRITMNSPTFNLGMLNLVAFPMDKNYKDRTYATLQNNEHTTLLAKDSTSAVLEVPFAHILNFLSTNTTGLPETFARVGLYVIVPLQTKDGGSNSVDVSIWMEPVHPDTQIPITQHTPKFLTLERGEHVTPLMNGAGPLETLLPAAGKAILSCATKGGAFDCPVDPTFSDDNVAKSGHSLAYGSGRKAAEILDLVPYDNYFLSWPKTGFVKENIKDIIQRPAYFCQRPISASQAAGTRILTCPVTPLTSYASTVEKYYNVTPTNCAHFAQMYRQWRGSIVYSFQWVGAASMNVLLMFVWVPNVIDPADLPANIQEASGYMKAIINVQEASTWQFKVPFDYPTNWALVNDNVPYGLYSPDYNVEQPSGQNCYNGTLCCYIVNQLTHPSNTPDNGVLLCYQAAGDDMEFRAINYAGSVDRSIELTLTSDAEPVVALMGEPTMKPDYQTSITRVQENTVTTTNLQYGDTPLAPGGRDMNSLEDEMDIYTLVKRYYLLGSQVFPGQLNYSQVARPVTPTQLSTYDASDLLNPLAKIAQGFTFWRGGMIYYFQTNAIVTDRSHGTVRHDIDSSAPLPVIEITTPPFTSTLKEYKLGLFAQYHTVYNPSRSNTIAVHCPFKTNYDALLVEQPGWSNDRKLSTNGAVTFAMNPVPQGFAFYSYYAAGDNFQLCGWVSPPFQRFSQPS